LTNPREKKLLDRVRDAIRAKHYSIRTEQAYLNWIRRRIFFHDKRHPLEMEATEIEEYLTYLAVDQNVAASTQYQALGALLFLYQNVLRRDLERPLDAVRAKKPKRLPIVLTRAEVQIVLWSPSKTISGVSK
jgi:site-specific recombinase XerD